METHDGNGGANPGKKTDAKGRRRQYFARNNARKKKAATKKKEDRGEYLTNPDWDPFG